MPYTAYAIAKTKRRPHNVRKVRRTTRKVRYRRRPVFRRGFRKRSNYRGIPYQDIVRFKLRAQTINVNPAAATSYYTFNLNELYDPLAGQGTSQPYLFDHYADLYDTYRVLSGVWYVTFVNEGGNPLRLAYCVSEVSTPPTSYRIVAEQKNGRACMLSAASGSKNMQTIKIPWNSNRYFKGTGIEDQQAAFTTYPTSRLFLHMYMESVKYDGSPANIVGVISITAYFRTLLSGYKRQAISTV